MHVFFYFENVIFKKKMITAKHIVFSVPYLGLRDLGLISL